MQIKSAIDMGRIIRLSRQQKDWSQSKLAKELGTSQRWVSEIENGKNRAELGRVLKCLRILDIKIDAKILSGSLITGMEYKEPQELKNHELSLREMVSNGILGTGTNEKSIIDNAEKILKKNTIDEKK